MNAFCFMYSLLLLLDMAKKKKIRVYKPNDILYKIHDITRDYGINPNTITFIKHCGAET